MRRQLEHVHREFEIDQPARPELHVERARSAACGAPCRRASSLRRATTFARSRGIRRMLVDHRRDALRAPPPSRTRAGRGTRPYAPTSRLPCADTARRRRARRRACPSRPRDEPRVDVVQRAGGGRNAQRGGDAAREAVEIVVGAERLAAVRRAALRGACADR